MTTPSTSTPPTPAAAPARPPLVERIAGAPISWGVCEVPGWGHQLDVGTGDVAPPVTSTVPRMAGE